MQRYTSALILNYPEYYRVRGIINITEAISGLNRSDYDKPMSFVTAGIRKILNDIDANPSKSLKRIVALNLIQEELADLFLDYDIKRIFKLAPGLDRRTATTNVKNMLDHIFDGFEESMHEEFGEDYDVRCKFYELLRKLYFSIN